MSVRVDRLRWCHCFAQIHADCADTPIDGFLATMCAREAEHILTALSSSELAKVIGEQFTPHPMLGFERSMQATHNDLRRQAQGALGLIGRARSHDPYQAWAHAQLDLFMQFLQRAEPREGFSRRTIGRLKCRVASDRSLSPSDPLRPLPVVCESLVLMAYDYLGRYGDGSEDIIRKMIACDRR